MNLEPFSVGVGLSLGLVGMVIIYVSWRICSNAWSTTIREDVVSLVHKPEAQTPHEQWPEILNWQPDDVFDCCDSREVDEPAPSVVEKHQRASKSPAGSSWPPDAVIPDDWVRDAAAARARAGKTQIDLEPEAERFANHFAANGKRMKDWRRAWLHWATSPYVDQLKGSGNGSRTGTKSQLEQLADIARNGLHGTVING